MHHDVWEASQMQFLHFSQFSMSRQKIVHVPVSSWIFHFCELELPTSQWGFSCLAPYTCEDDEAKMEQCPNC